jgi:hypothetical protein
MYDRKHLTIDIRFILLQVPVDEFPATPEPLHNGQKDLFKRKARPFSLLNIAWSPLSSIQYFVGLDLCAVSLRRQLLARLH